MADWFSSMIAPNSQKMKKSIDAALAQKQHLRKTHYLFVLAVM